MKRTDQTDETGINVSKKLKLPKKGSQSRRVYDFMADGNAVTSLMCIDREVFDPIIMRLPNRISELRNKYGHLIYQKGEISKVNKRIKWQVYSLTPFEDM